MTDNETPLTDKETAENFVQLELFNRILKLRAAIKICSLNAEKAIIARPDNVSEVAWMASHLGDIFRSCQKALGDDFQPEEAPTEENVNG